MKEWVQWKEAQRRIDRKMGEVNAAVCLRSETEDLKKEKPNDEKMSKETAMFNNNHEVIRKLELH